MSDTLRSLFSASKSAHTAGDSTLSNTNDDVSTTSQEVRPDMAPGAEICVVGTGGGGSNGALQVLYQPLSLANHTPRKRDGNINHLVIKLRVYSV